MNLPLSAMATQQQLLTHIVIKAPGALVSRAHLRHRLPLQQALQLRQIGLSACMDCSECPHNTRVMSDKHPRHCHETQWAVYSHHKTGQHVPQQQVGQGRN
jgi:hypothetical protein